MSGKKHNTNSPFLFTRGERNGIIVLISLTLSCIVVPAMLINKQEKSYVREIQRNDSLLLAKTDAAYQLQLQAYKNTNDNTKYNSKVSREHPSKKSLDVIAINSASASDLMALPGIGGILSERIVKYREKLGGFYSPAQLKEVYGLPEETCKQIEGLVSCDKRLRKINVNSADLEEMDAHPYISPKLAGQILAYRQKVKPFSKVEDIKVLYLMNDSLYRKLSPYISVE